MNTYKIGNKVKCIIRAYAAGDIGEETMTYANQPYTVLKDVQASLNFSSQSKLIKHNSMNELNFNVDFPSEIKLSNILLTDRILNLIYSKNEDKLCSTSENVVSDGSKYIYLNTSADEIYQVFIYDEDGELETAYGTKSLSTPIAVENADSNYLVFYSYVGTKSVNLDRATNLYVTLDLEVCGNIDNNTTPMFIHLDKCALTSDKTMLFNGTSNSIDLTFKILDSENHSYITFK